MEAVGDATDQQVQRGRILDRWLSRLKDCGIEQSKEMPLVRGADKNALLYYLVFAAQRSPRAKPARSIPRPRVRRRRA
jgi:hypothetical protein